MQIDNIISTDPKEWNAFVTQEPSFSLLQSWEWGEFKQKLGWKAFRVVVRRQGRIAAGAQLLVKPVISGLASVAYIPRGPVGDWLETGIAEELLTGLHQIARGHRAVFLKIEPPLLDEAAFERILKEHHFRASPHNNQPRATIVMNIEQDLDGILMQMRKKTRQYIRKAEREGVTVRVGDHGDLSTFRDIMQLTGSRKGFAHRSREYYDHEWQIFSNSRQTVLLMALHRDQVQAVRTAYCFGEHAAEFHAGSVDSPTNRLAAYLLVWEAIKWAKAQGCRTYDLWGIPDEMVHTTSEGDDPPVPNRTDGLWGVYRFKRGFSRNVVCYIGAYDYAYNLPLYSVVSSRLVDASTSERIIAWMDRLKRT